MNTRVGAIARPLLAPLVAVAALAVLMLLAHPATAHEHVTSGDLEFVVGWGTEPPVVYQMNTITIEVHRNLQPSGSEPVGGVADNLTVTVSTGITTAQKLVEEEFGNPGTYSFAIVPTREGTYTIGVTGQVNGTPFNVSTEIDDAVLGLDVNFPATDPTLKDLNDNATAQQAQIEALRAEIAMLQGGGGGVTQAQLDEANGQASTALMVGFAGVVVGAIGLAVGAAGMRRGGGNGKKE